MIEKSILKEMYVNKGMSQSKIGKELNVSQSVVSYYCRKYKLKATGYINNAKHWTDKQLEILIDLYGKYSYDYIATQVKKSPKAIEGMVYKLKLGRASWAGEDINSNELARQLGRSPSSIRRWIDNNGLPASKRVLKTKKKFYRIKVKEFWKWAKDNSLMDWTKYEIGNIPNEPKWLLKVKKKAIPKTRKRWNPTQDALLISYYKQGYKLKDIAKKLDRTFRSVDMRLVNLKVKRKQVQLNWQPIEINIMLDMIEEGKTLVQVAEELGRTYDSVSAKYLIIKNIGNQISA
jgi:predicted transcriptional regulator